MALTNLERRLRAAVRDSADRWWGPATAIPTAHREVLMSGIIPIGPRRADSDVLLELLPKEDRVLIRRVLKHARDEAGAVVRQFVRIKQVNKVLRLGTLQFLKRFTRRFSPAAVPGDEFTARQIYIKVIRDFAETFRRDRARLRREQAAAATAGSAGRQ